MDSLDRVVSRMRLWVEDRLPWYDREAEVAAHARTEIIRQRSIRLRKTAEDRTQTIRTEALAATQRFPRP